MNDSTKKELIWMLENYKRSMYLGVKPAPMLPVVIKTLEYMIDNYCETFEGPNCHSLRKKLSPNSFCCEDYKYDNP